MHRYSVRGNLTLDVVEKAKQEVGLYKASGGGCMCEMSVVGMRRENHTLTDLVNISMETGVHIIAATGFYSESFLSAEVRGWSVHDMAEYMTEEIARGSRHTGVKCGVMYLACTDPLKDTERKTLEAAAITHKQTGMHCLVSLEGGVWVPPPHSLWLA